MSGQARRQRLHLFMVECVFLTYDPKLTNRIYPDTYAIRRQIMQRIKRQVCLL